MQANVVQQALRKTSQLRALVLMLKRAKDQQVREQRLSEFEVFRHSLESRAGESKSLPLPPPDVILTGVQASWARKDVATIRAVASVLPKEWLDQHRLLHAYVSAAINR